MAEDYKTEPVELEWARAFADHGGTCQPCQRETNRIVAFRAPGAPRFDAMFICDSCLRGLTSVAVRQAGDG